MTQQRLSTLSLRVRNLPPSSRASSYEAFSNDGEVGRKARVVLRLLNVRLELEARYGDARRAPRVEGTQGRSRAGDGIEGCGEAYNAVGFRAWIGNRRRR